MPYQAIGVAITKEMITRIKKSFDNNCTMPVTLEPSTLRIPISLLRCSALNAARPNRPRQEITMATSVNELMICESTISSWKRTTGKTRLSAHGAWAGR